MLEHFQERIIQLAGKHDQLVYAQYIGNILRAKGGFNSFILF